MFEFAKPAQRLQNWKLTLAYDGTDYRGWQVQPDEPTIQGELQAALVRVTSECTLPQGSGRTDAGVHALAQVASFELRAWQIRTWVIRFGNSLIDRSAGRVQ